MLASYVTSFSEHVNSKWLARVSLQDPQWRIPRHGVNFDQWSDRRSGLPVFYSNTVNFVINPTVSPHLVYRIYHLFLLSFPFSVFRPPSPPRQPKPPSSFSHLRLQTRACFGLQLSTSWGSALNCSCSSTWNYRNENPWRESLDICVNFKSNRRENIYFRQSYPRRFYNVLIKKESTCLRGFESCCWVGSGPSIIREF